MGPDGFWRLPCALPRSSGAAGGSRAAPCDDSECPAPGTLMMFPVRGGGRDRSPRTRGVGEEARGRPPRTRKRSIGHVYDTRRVHGTWSSAPAKVNMVAVVAEIKELFTRQKRSGCRGSFTRTAQHGSLARKDSSWPSRGPWTYSLSRSPQSSGGPLRSRRSNGLKAIYEALRSSKQGPAD